MEDETPEQSIILQMPPWFKNMLARKSELEMLMDDLQKRLMFLQREHGFLNGWVAHMLLNSYPAVEALEGDAVGWEPAGKTKVKVFKVSMPDDSPLSDDMLKKYISDITVLQSLNVPWDVIKQYVKIKDEGFDPSEFGFTDEEE